MANKSCAAGQVETKDATLFECIWEIYMHAGVDFVESWLVIMSENLLRVALLGGREYDAKHPKHAYQSCPWCLRFGSCVKPKTLIIWFSYTVMVLVTGNWIIMTFNRYILCQETPH